MQIPLSKAVIIGIALLAFCYTGLWILGANGSEMAASERYGSHGGPRIVIRKLPAFHKFWLIPLSPFILEDNPEYRFELYWPDSSIIRSCQSYSGESYVARTAKIKWSDSGEATVFLDDLALFKCDSFGFWTEVR